MRWVLLLLWSVPCFAVCEKERLEYIRAQEACDTAQVLSGVQGIIGGLLIPVFGGLLAAPNAIAASIACQQAEEWRGVVQTCEKDQLALAQWMAKIRTEKESACQIARAKIPETERMLLQSIPDVVQRTVRAEFERRVGEGYNPRNPEFVAAMERYQRNLILDLLRRMQVVRLEAEDNLRKLESL